MRRRTRILLLGIVLVGLAGPATVTPVAAKAPPEPVCGVCTEALDAAASDRGVNIERDRATMTVQLFANGTAAFVARVEITRGADRLRNASLRNAIVRDVSYTLVADRRHLRTAMDGSTLVVRYLGEGLAHRTVGVLRFDAFVTRDAPLALGGEGSPYPGADRLTLRAPTDYRLYGSHGDASNETAIVWYGDSHRQFAGDIAEDVVISFVPETASAPGVRVRIAGVVDWIDSLVPSTVATVHSSN